MIQTDIKNGYALFSTVWIVAILSMLSLAMLSDYLGNTRDTLTDLQRIQINHLHEAGVRYAALSLATPRKNVIATAVPIRKLQYRSSVGQVLVKIENEASFIDLTRAQPDLLKQLFASLAVSDQQAAVIHQNLTNPVPVNENKSYTYRKLRTLLADTQGLFHKLMARATLHNGRAGVHPMLAKSGVLELIPDLPTTDRHKLLERRSNNQPSLIISKIESEHFTNTVSAYYRITTKVSVPGRDKSRTQIIKMTNQPGRLFKLVATL